MCQPKKNYPPLLLLRAKRSTRQLESLDETLRSARHSLITAKVSVKEPLSPFGSNESPSPASTRLCRMLALLAFVGLFFEKRKNTKKMFF